MIAAKVTLTSTVLAAVMGLALGLMAAPAGADCPHRDNPDHKHCDGGGKPPKDSGPANPVIAFTTGHTFPIYEIKVMDADGGNQTVVLHGGLARTDQPSWSPDGRFLAFFASQSILGCPEGPGVGLVELINSDTNEWSAPIPLVCNNHGTATPAFSPVQVGDTYTLAYFGREGALPLPGGRITEDIIVITFHVPSDDEPVIEVGPVNITNTPGIAEIWPSWSPSGDEIVVDALDISADPDEPDTWVHDIVIYDAAGGGELASLVKDNAAFDGMTVDRVDNPDWAKANTSAEMILFGLQVVGGDWDIWCVERSTGAAINVTQHLDDGDGAERSDLAPSWLPDDSGFLFARDINRQIIEMRFGDGYDPAAGCPDESNLISASNVVLAQGKGRRKVGQPDYWRNAP